MVANSLEESAAAAAAATHDPGLGKRWTYIGRDSDQNTAKMKTAVGTQGPEQANWNGPCNDHRQ